MVGEGFKRQLTAKTVGISRKKPRSPSMSTLCKLAKRGKVEKFQSLLEAGADINCEDKDGWTPLHWAAALGRIEMARRLVEAGADVNAQDDNGYTPLDATNYAPEYEPEAKVVIADYLREKGGLTAEERRTKPSPQ